MKIFSTVVITLFLLPQIIFSQFAVDSNTIALWRFDEASGSTVSDASGKSNNGIATGTSIVNGLFGNARYFTGNVYVDFGNTTSLQLTNQFTIEAYIKVDSLPKTGIIAYIAGKYDGSTSDITNNFQFGILQTGKIEFKVGSNTYTLVSKNVIPLKTWFHVAVTYNGGLSSKNMKIYLNRNLDTFMTRTGPAPTNSSPLLVGQRNKNGANCTSCYHNGTTVDEIRISNIERGFNAPLQTLYKLPWGEFDLGPTGFIWSVNYNYWAYKINRITGVVSDSIKFKITPNSSVDEEGRGVAWDGSNLWYSEWGLDSIFCINPSNGEVLKKIKSPGNGPQGLAWDNGFLWHTDEYEKLIYKISASDGKIVKTLNVPGQTGWYGGIAKFDKYLFVSNVITKKVFKVDTTNGKAIDSTILSFTPIELACDNNFLYVGSIDSLYHISSVNNQYSLAKRYSLSQNFPNPFNPSTTITYDIPNNGFVSLKIYDMLGREVASLVNNEQSAGSYQTQWNAEGFSSGLYIAKISAGGFTKSIKMTLMK